MTLIDLISLIFGAMMCKVMMIAGLQPKHKQKAEILAKEMMKIISKTEKDGFGYAAISASGNIYGEKYLEATDFMSKNVTDVDPTFIKVKETLGDAIKDVIIDHTKYKSYGIKSSTPVAMIVHARWSTIGAKEINNCHPFFSLEEGEQTALIHNGTIKNHLDLTKKYSTCDSEVILHEYIKNNMNHNPYGIHNLAKTLKGEYAVGVLGNSELGPFLDIFKSNKPLHAGYVKELGCLAFATDAAQLAEAVRAAGMTIKSIVELVDGRYMRFNAITGQRINEVINFTPSDLYNYWVEKKTVTPTTTITETKKEIVVIPMEKYVENLKLTDIEKKYLIDLESNGKTNKIALQLVKLVIGSS